MCELRPDVTGKTDEYVVGRCFCRERLQQEIDLRDHQAEELDGRPALAAAMESYTAWLRSRLADTPRVGK